MSKITNSFLVVTNYNNDISWIPDYTDNYVIYNKCGSIPSNIDSKKVIEQTKFGQGMYDYLCYIVDNYDNLPPLIQFVKGNIFPRLMPKKLYDKLCNNNYFTPLENYGNHKVKYPESFMSCDGGYVEYNNSNYLLELPHRYFQSYNHFLKYVYQDPIFTVFIRFAPGGCYIVHREQIRKLPKRLYESLKGFLVYALNPAEAHMMERCIYTWWNSNMTPNMLHLEEKERSSMKTTLRKATEDDSKFLLFSHNICRDGFLNVNEVTVKEHKDWFEKNKDFIYICELDDIPVGSVRNKYGELHWEIIPEYRGKGLATIFVKKLINLSTQKRIWASIKPENIASVRVALNNGFIKKDTFTWEL